MQTVGGAGGGRGGGRGAGRAGGERGACSFDGNYPAAVLVLRHRPTAGPAQPGREPRARRGAGGAASCYTTHLFSGTSWLRYQPCLCVLLLYPDYWRLLTSCVGSWAGEPGEVEMKAVKLLQFCYLLFSALASVLLSGELAAIICKLEKGGHIHHIHHLGRHAQDRHRGPTVQGQGDPKLLCYAMLIYL